jgi:CHAT domain-containing protein/tetratricopeptide (TPR) repeat protein
MSCRLFHDVDMSIFVTILEPGSISHLEFLTVPPVWDNQSLAPPPRDLALPPKATYAVAVADAVFVGFSKGRVSLLTVFSDADGQRCTKRWSVEIRTSREHSARALFMVPPEAIQFQTWVPELSQLVSRVSQPLQVEQFPKGLELAGLARDRARQECRGDDAGYADKLTFLGSAYEGMGDYAAAEPLFREALEVRRKALGADQPEYGVTLHNLANLFVKMGDYAAAEPLFCEALEVFRKALGADHLRYAYSLDNLAAVHMEMGDYAAAEPLFRRALEVLRAALGADHPDYARTLFNLAILLLRMGDYAAAEPLLRRAQEVRRKALGESHPDYAQSLHFLAILNSDLGDHAAAEPLLREALEVRRKALGADHPEYARTLGNLAKLYIEMGDYAAAEPLLREALEVMRTALGADHPDCAIGMWNLAAMHELRGDYAAAELLIREALEACRKALGADHPQYAQGLFLLALHCVATGRGSDALALMEEAGAIDDRMIGQIFSIASERQRAAFLASLRGRTHLLLALVLGHLAESPEAVRVALDLVLRRKALTAEGQAAQRDAVLGGRYPHLRPAFRELQSLQERIVRKALAGPGPEGADAHGLQLAQWVGRREELERDLAREVPEMNLERALRAADRRAVALGLPEGVALIEFVRFQDYDLHAVPLRGVRQLKPERYAAFVLRAGEPDEPRLIDLGEAGPIDRLIADFRAGIIAEAEEGDGRNMAKRQDEASSAAAGDPGLALRVALFDRLDPALGIRRRFLIAPDGDLTRLPFEVLPTSDGRRLIDDYEISYVSCGRDVLRLGEEATGQPGEPLVVADPDFDAEAMITTGSVSGKPGFWSRLLGRGKQAIKTPTPPVPTPATVAPSARRHSRDLHRDRSSYHFHRLPGTRAEGERVATRLGVAPWLDASALEGRLKAECRSPRILHVATHGFFLTDQQRDLSQEGQGFAFDLGDFSDARGGLGRLSGPSMENPMLRSGLALAGANTWLRAGKPPEEAEDGLLTAEDVTGLDLLATELVVLSACETGLGQVHVGEGVFGLRRAFVLAGAKTLVISLWKVPDEPTRELMEDFYGRLLAGQGRAEALRQAQLAMKARYPEPFFWGAFICQGDPSPLGMARPGIGPTRCD